MTGQSQILFYVHQLSTCMVHVSDHVSKYEENSSDYDYDARTDGQMDGLNPFLYSPFNYCGVGNINANVNRKYIIIFKGPFHELIGI